jgi:hypothetical protein
VNPSPGKIIREFWPPYSGAPIVRIVQRRGRYWVDCYGQTAQGSVMFYDVRRAHAGYERIVGALMQVGI